MKKLLLAVAALLCLGILAAGQPAAARSVNDFTIPSFEADYYLTQNDKGVAQLRVVETLTARFPSYDQNHGIERALPVKYRQNRLNLSVEAVQANGSNATYTTYKYGNYEVVRIGDADTYVHGDVRYVITYTMRDVITFADVGGKPYPHDEWYWNVNGTDWQQPFGTVKARIHMSRELADKLLPDAVCYTGEYESTDSDCTISYDTSNADVSVKADGSLGPGENLSFVLAFQRGSFVPYQSHPLLGPTVVITSLIAAVVYPLTCFMIFYRRWLLEGRDPQGRGTIVPEYEPPKQLHSVAEAGIVLTKQLAPKYISAVVIDLCVRGYLKLYEEEKGKLFTKKTDYKLEIVKGTSRLSTTDKAVVEALFGKGAAVGAQTNLSTHKNKLYSKMNGIKKDAVQRLVQAKYFPNDPDKQKKRAIGYNLRLAALAFVGIAIGGVVLLGSLNSFVFEGDLAQYYTQFIVLFVVGSTVVLITAIWFGAASAKRSEAGVAMVEYLKGLEMYMKMAEADRIAFLQSVSGAERIDTTDNQQLVKLYEALLPYAMLFGIDKSWAKQFADLYGTDQSPTWYSGRSAFNSAVFASSISGLSSATTSSFTSPSSSGSSGFSGGGFSGGGGGGGGGGGW